MNEFELPPQVPASGSVITRGLGRALMRLFGWHMGGAFPNLPKFVILIAPHTSNWDFFVAAAAKLALGIRVSWIAKDSIFRWPVVGILRAMGGFPVDRNSPHGVVHHVVEEFNARSQMVFGLTPEGTRKRVEHWRSGYWHVAHDARVPMVTIALDYGTRTVRVGAPLDPSESLEQDEAKLRAVFARVTAKRQANYKL